MDMKRFTEIEGREALERLANGLEIYGFSGLKYQVDFSISDYKLWSGEKECGNGEEIATPLTLTEILKETWYVKKPFDIRAEMLARPDEWVGAFEDKSGHWHKVGFSTDSMTVVETAYWNKENINNGSNMWKIELSECIPIEDVPEEEI